MFSFQSARICSCIEKYEKEFCKNDYYGDSSAPLSVQTFGNTSILISAPHATNHIRNEKIKVHETNTGALARKLAEDVGCSYIAKPCTKDLGDPNYDESCVYKDIISEYIKEHNVSLFVDLHGMSYTHKEAIDIGVNGGNNIDNNGMAQKLAEIINGRFKSTVACIDKYFQAAPAYTMSRYVHDNLGIPAIQLEINSRYRKFKDEHAEKSILLMKSIEAFLQTALA